MISRRQADQAIDDPQADALLEGLAKRYSPSGHEGAAVSYLVKQMRTVGFEAAVDGAGNAVGEWGDGERTILLLGHIDTVPGLIDVRRESNLLYGRGTVDAKGPLAAFIVAASRVGVQPGKRIVVVGAVEEESATSRGARFLLDRLTPEAVIIGEPSGWNGVTIGYKGRLLIDYTSVREVGHTAGPRTSVCEQAVAFWQEVSNYATEWNRGRQGMLNQLAPSLRQICSEDDAFLQKVTMIIGLRLPLCIDVDVLQNTLVALVEDAALGFRGREEAFRASKNTPLVRAFIRAIRAEGERPTFKVKSGTSDMNVVGPVWNCPILAYGPGDSALDHTPREHIDLDEYHRAIQVLTCALQEL